MRASRALLSSVSQSSGQSHTDTRDGSSVYDSLFFQPSSHLRPSQSVYTSSQQQHSMQLDPQNVSHFESHLAAHTHTHTHTHTHRCVRMRYAACACAHALHFKACLWF